MAAEHQRQSNQNEMAGSKISKTTHQLNDIKAVVEKLSRLASELSATRHHSSTIHTARSQNRQRDGGTKYELLEINHNNPDGAQTSSISASSPGTSQQQSPQMSPSGSQNVQNMGRQFLLLFFKVTALREKVRGIARQVAQFEEVIKFNHSTVDSQRYYPFLPFLL
jgi:hypothetical protein